MSVGKRILSALRTLTGARRTDARAHHHAAVILAAGMGSRAGGTTTKQMRLLAGKPLIIHTLRAFSDSPYIHEIVLVGRAEELADYPPMLRQYGIEKVTKIVAGGATRQESSRIGVNATSQKTRYVSIHDGARCLITPALIERVVRAAYMDGHVCAAACRAKDTVKIANAKGFVTSTPARDTVWQVQTPQVFSIEKYRAAVWHAQKESLAVTDDCMMAEAVGFPVRLVDCGYENLKVTTPEDFSLALSVLHGRGMFEETEEAANEV